MEEEVGQEKKDNEGQKRATSVVEEEKGERERLGRLEVEGEGEEQGRKTESGLLFRECLGAVRAGGGDYAGNTLC